MSTQLPVGAQEMPLLRTKLYIPPPRPELVPRPRLIEQLNAGLHRKLTLISAPAGFGKTTLVSEWVVNLRLEAMGEATPPRAIAWLSLDENDNDLARFLSYVIAALQSVQAGIGQGLLSALQSQGPLNVDMVLATLLNETANLDDFLLILDDYHAIELPEIDQALAFLLDHLPPQMHLVIASRTDPTLPLSRLRARGQLTELREADLRFTTGEVATFLKQAVCLPLSTDNVRTLEDRTEGWITGLQLAAVAMQSLGQSDQVADFIHSFGGSHRYIIDYLVDEVLERQPRHLQAFLLQTSILDRLTGSLCSAVTSREDSQAILERLDTANLFLIPLDGQRHWYRYHHLFADLLRRRLRLTHPEQIPTLHGRASEWYERNGLPSDAIRHAIAAQDFKRAADLAELAWPAWSGSFQSIAWLGWVKELPHELVHARPVLCVAYAWAFLNAGILEAAEARLLDAERWMEPTRDASEQLEGPSTEMVVVDKEQFRSLPASLATARAYHSQAIGDVPATVKYARRVLDLVPEGAHQWRGDATALLGLAYWASGDLEAAHRTFSDGLAGMDPLDVIVGTFVLADIKRTLGYLHEAVRTCERALRLAAEHGDPMPIGTEDVYTEISKLHRERGNLEAAAQDLLAAKRLGDQVELPDWQYRWCIAQARLKETIEDLDGALDLLGKAERQYVRTPLPDVRPIAALRARVWVAQGSLAKAQDWARERGLSVDDDLTYLHEFEHVTLARVLIAQYKSGRVERSIHKAVELLERLRQAAEEGGRTGSVIEILVLHALAHQVQGDTPAALGSLERALTLAEPEGYVRIFVDEGPPMANLLSEAAIRESMPDYTAKLLAAFQAAEPLDLADCQANSGKNKDKSCPASDQPLVEPLSPRELEVLQLIAQGLSNREIGERLFIALDTVKGHNRSIYAKLAIKNRTQAINKARALGILSAQ